MRQFRVGDKVKWYQSGFTPLWSFEFITSTGGSGCWMNGVVTSVADDDTFAVGRWRWPQPGHTLARYGEPGYLELVETVKEPRFVVREDDLGHLYVADLELGLMAASAFPEACRPELESICAKLNKKEGTP